MAVDTWTPSRRLQSAAVAEQQRLQRELQRIAGRIASVRRELAELEAARSGLAERLQMLELLASGTEGDVLEFPVNRRDPTDDEAGRKTEGSIEAQTLRGARIRHVAVGLLARSPRAQEALHYRTWYRLLIDAGFAVAGKDPEATFLTQIGRSPVVRRSTQAGIYELDLEFVPKARSNLERLRQELRAAHDLPADATAEQLEAARSLRARLRGDIDALERELQEALETLGEPGGPI